jgi:hypothetical protein
VEMTLNALIWLLQHRHHQGPRLLNQLHSDLAALDLV